MTERITNERQIFGSYLQRILRERRIGQAPLASYLGTTVGMISKYTTGRNLPSDEKMELITEFLRNFLSENEQIELTKLYLEASTSIKLVEAQTYSLSDLHFLQLFNDQTLEQQREVIETMLQNAEDNRVKMAQNAGLENTDEPQGIRYETHRPGGFTGVAESRKDKTYSANNAKKSSKRGKGVSKS